MMQTTTVVFRVGDTDRQTIKTMFLRDVPLSELPAAIADRGANARHQFPPSAVRIVSVTRRTV